MKLSWKPNLSAFHDLIVLLVLASPLALMSAHLATSPDALASSSRQKVIDFEDQLVEGMNKTPLDSVSQVSDRAKRKKKAHLYRKRVGFRAETAQTLRDLRYAQ